MSLPAGADHAVRAMGRDGPGQGELTPPCLQVLTMEYVPGVKINQGKELGQVGCGTGPSWPSGLWSPTCSSCSPSAFSMQARVLPGSHSVLWSPMCSVPLFDEAGCCLQPVVA